MPLATLNRHLEERRKHIDGSIEEVIESYPWNVPALRDAVHYSVSGGKRLRSIIMLSVYNQLSKSKDEPMAFAVGIEMIQAYSLVHDDLPCMDDDDYRRGRLSCHKRFGEAVALLCGDALLTMAFESMLSCKNVPQGRVLRAALEIAKAAGPCGMVGGQVLDLISEGQTGACCNVPEMYKMKTGALFEGSARVGAILAGASCDTVDSAASWGRLFGYAYQIIDDIEDAGAGGKEETKNTLLKTLTVKQACCEARDALEAASAIALGIGRQPRGQALIKDLSGLYLSNIEAIEKDF
ncbi:MAG TPA: polyprenyl synthetase family protein [Firmicutes bacterium]|nr:polyprenyl synthetase family protein [Candidatus Fermentithermobacillaceae bacterium]